MNKQKLHTALFLGYGAIMLWLLFDRPGYDPAAPYWDQVTAQLNLIPFRTLRLFADLLNSGVRSHITIAVINLGGNIFLFIPIGYFLPRLWPSLRNFLFFLLTCTLAIVLVELLQLVTLLGSLDIDDLILNLFGMLLGYLFFIIFKK